MVKLATPISTLCKDDVAILMLKEQSACFEGRESNFADDKVELRLFHFDKDLVHLWEEDLREKIGSIINKNKSLELISFHIASCYEKPIIKNEVFYPFGEIVLQETMLDNAKKNVGYLKTVIGKRNISIAAENNNFYPTGAYQYITQPEFISSIIWECDIYFLYDIAHAKITTYNEKTDYEKYRQKLPLEKLIQLHISKEDIDNKGIAYDAHNLPDELIYKEAKELLDNFYYRYLTVEYYKDIKNLMQTLDCYKRIFETGDKK